MWDGARMCRGCGRRTRGCAGRRMGPAREESRGGRAGLGEGARARETERLLPPSSNASAFDLDLTFLLFAFGAMDSRHQQAVSSGPRRGPGRSRPCLGLACSRPSSVWQDGPAPSRALRLRTTFLGSGFLGQSPRRGLCPSQRRSPPGGLRLGWRPRVPSLPRGPCAVLRQQRQLTRAGLQAYAASSTAGIFTKTTSKKQNETNHRRQQRWGIRVL